MNTLEKISESVENIDHIISVDAKASTSAFPRSKQPIDREGSVKFSVDTFINKHSGLCVNDHYEIGDRLGSGGYASVYVCTHKATGQIRAIKVIPRSASIKDNERVANEFLILKELDHPNILKVYDWLEDEENYYFLTDMCSGGELFDEIVKRGKFDETNASQLMNQILSCVNYCHQRNIVHRDLKPENILLGDEDKEDFGDITIIDFGLAFEFDEKKKNNREMLGSVFYMAPEVLNGSYWKQPKLGPKCDIWSCGVITYMLLSGIPPFTDTSAGKNNPSLRQDTKKIIQKVIGGNFDFPSPLWGNISEEAKDFITQMLTYDFDSRPTAQEALQHPWLVDSRKETLKDFSRRSSDEAMIALYNLKHFQAKEKIKQAACTFIASQLLVKKEKEKLDEIFRALDTKRNGKLSKEEFKEGYQKYSGTHFSNKEMENIFDRVDVNGNGFIEYSEFVVAAMEQNELLCHRNLKLAFNTFDKDGSGYITAEDLKKALRIDGHNEFSSQIIDEMIEQVDKDCDGDISFEEFTEMMLD